MGISHFYMGTNMQFLGLPGFFRISAILSPKILCILEIVAAIE